MTKLLLVLALVIGLLLGAFVYQQAVIEGSFGPAALFGTAALGVAFFATLTMYFLSRTRYQEAVANLLLAGSAVVVTYFVADFITGTILIRPLSPPLVPDDYRHHKLVPDSVAELSQRDFTYRQHVNKLGLRGKETSAAKPQGTRRVLMLGDSFTMGKGVAEDQTFPVLVERILREAASSCGGPLIEVLNGGVDSYAPVLSLLQFKRDLTSLAPDLVVLNLDLSDLVQEAAYRQQAVLGPDGEIVAVPQLAQNSVYERFRSWTSQHLFFTRVILVYATRAFGHRELTVRRVVNEMGREHFAHTLEGDVDRKAQWRDVFDSIGLMKVHADSLGMGFLLTTYPWAHQLGENGWVPGRYEYMKRGERTTDLSARTIREHSAALGIELLEMEPIFRAYEGTEPLYFAYDPHWTPAGQRVMAEGLARYLIDHHVVRWCGMQ